MVFENLKMAMSSLFANKMRSFLTMLGIIIGIGAVIITTSLGDTVRKMFSDLFVSIGRTQAYLSVNSGDIWESDLITEDDVKTYLDVFKDKLVYIDYYDTASSEIKTKLKTQKMSFEGVGSMYFELTPQYAMERGRFITDRDVQNAENVCVIKNTDALTLFGTEDAVGRSFRCVMAGEYRQFTIVGIYKSTLSPLQAAMMGGTSDIGSIFVPMSLFKPWHNSAYMLRVYADPQMSNPEVESLMNELKTYVIRSKGLSDPEAYDIYSASEQMGQFDEILGTLSLVLSSIALISLLVGGIGIMNIMLVSVTERTKEIGIRKALGATTGDILQQFLIESAVLSGVGGMLGTIFAAVMIYAVGISTKTDVVIRPMSVVIAVGFSALVGLFFGIYPARKAANKDPIEALRFE